MIDLDELEKRARAAQEDWDGFVWQRFWEELSEDDLLNLIDRVRMAEAEHDAEVVAKAWDEGYWQGINGHTGPGNPYRAALELNEGENDD